MTQPTSSDSGGAGPSPRRVLLLTNMYPSAQNPHGGAFVRERVRQMKSAGCEVRVIGIGGQGAPTSAGSLGQSWVSEACVAVLSKRQRLTIRLRGTDDEVNRSLAGDVLARLSGRDFDAVIAHGMYGVSAGHVAALVAQRLQLPFFVFLHGSDVNVTMRRSPKRFLPVLESASAVFCVSTALQRTLRNYGLRRPALLLAPNGVDPDTFKVRDRAQVRSEFGLPKDGMVVAYVGNLIRIKGADRLPAIFRQIHRDDSDARFLVVGGGSMSESLARRFKRIPVSLLGQIPHDKVARVMSAADVVVLPSRNEGWPCVILEAHACGAEVVCADVGGSNEAAYDRGLVVSPFGNVAKRMAAAVLRAREFERGDALSEYGRSYAWASLVKAELAVMGLGCER